MNAFLLDVDGTTLLGPQAIPGAGAFVAYLVERRIPHLWLTNNTSLSRAAWRKRLNAAGFACSAQQIYTAGDATIDFLRRLDPVPRVVLVGTTGLAADFRAGGIDLVTDDAEADALVLAYDTSLTYEKLRRAALVLQRGAAFYATHPDPTCPSPDGPIPDVGSFLALFETACGRRARVIGKPEASMVAGALDRLGVPAAQATVVGDRLATDIRMANRAGIRSFLVLSGVTDRAEVAAAEDRPDAVFDSLAAVHAHLRSNG